MRETREAEEVREFEDRGIASREATVFAFYERAAGSVEICNSRSSMRGLTQDVRFGIRSFLRTPVATVVALTALTIGIGANSAIFNVINAILIRPLPYRDPANLYVIWSNKLDKGMRKELVSPADFRDFAGQNQLFDRIGGFRIQSAVLTGGELPERVQVARVSPAIFQILDGRAMYGRWFAPDEDQPSKNSVVILSDGIWRRRFGGNPGILGRSLNLDRKSYTIVGIAPAGFRLVDNASDVWIPYTPGPQELAPEQRGYRSLMVLAHLRPGVTRQRAQIEMQAAANRIADAYPSTNAGYSVDLIPLREQVVGDIRPTLWTLFGAVTFVLLIACANVANLLLARAGAREKEMAVRTSLGASPGRIVRQLLTESVLLALIGGLLGLALAYWATSVLVKLAPLDLARGQEIAPDWRVLAFTLCVSTFTGLVFGLAPALASARSDLNSILKTSGRGSTGHRSRSRTRDLLVVSEVASSVALLIGAGLLIRSFSRLQDVNPGFRADHVLTLQLSLSDSRYPGIKVGRFYQQLVERVRALPGVQFAGVCQYLPLSGRDVSLNFQIEGQPSANGADQPRAKLRTASPDYFKALGIPLLRGRFFNASDDAQTPKVVIVNQLAAERYWPHQDPIGKRILSGADTNEWSTIIGVVGNVKHAGLDADTSPETYYHYRQIPPEVMNYFEGTMALVIRTASDPVLMTSAVRGQIQQLDADLPVFNVRPMQEVVEGSIAQSRFRAVLLGGFAGLAVWLAALGLYGVMAYSVTQRSNELGVRAALGASPADILKLIAGHGIQLAAAGIGIGLVIAFAGTRLISGLLFGVGPFDPLAFGGACMTILAVALIASVAPAWRAAKVSPVIALRHE
jgi:putative ABC transport system permease protein